MEMVAELQKELAEKSEEIEKIRESKRVFADRGETQNFAKKYEQDITDAYVLGTITRKGWNTEYAKSLFEKAVNDTAGVAVPPNDNEDTYQNIASTAIERDIELELIVDPLFRKIQMNAATMTVPLMPDAGYAEFIAGAGTGTSVAPKGNLEVRGATHGSPFNQHIDMDSKLLTVSKLISKSYMAREVEEDSILPVLPLIRESMARSHARAIEHSLLMGGATDDLISSPYNGLVASAGSTLDLGSPGTGTPIVADKLLDMRQAMGKYGRRSSDVAYIISLDAYYDILDDADFQKANELGEVGTRITGDVGSVYGSPVYVCDEFPAKAADKPWGVCVNVRNFVVPVLRGVTVEQDDDVENQRIVLVASQRRGFELMFANGGANNNVVAHTY
jgi:hypothetical protein